MIKPPDTWQQVRFGEICEINPRLPDNLKVTDDNKVTFLPMAAVDEIFGEITEVEEKFYRDVKKGFTPFLDNDVLFAKITPSMENGKAAVARDLTNGIGFGSTEFHVIRCTEYVLPEFVFHFIRQSSFRLWAKSSFIGSAGQQRVPADFLKRIPFLLPTIPEQQRIAAILKQADALRRQRRENLEQAKQLPTVLFLEMFGDTRHDKQKWKKESLSKLVTVRSSLITPTPDEYAAWPCIGPDSIESGTGFIIDMPTVQDVQPQSGKYLFEEGDVLYSKIRPNLAKVALAECTGFCSADMYALLTGPKINPAFFQYLLLSEGFTQFALSHSGRAQMPKLNRSQLLSYLAIVPPMQLQEKFEGIVVELRKMTEIFESSRRDTEYLETLTTGKAFSGKLTEVWRETNHKELETWLRENPEYLPKKTTRISFKESVPPKQIALARPAHRWLMDQLGKVQSEVYRAVGEWKGTLIPSEELDRFLEEWRIEHLEDAHDHMKRALKQLAELGLIARLSVPNQAGEYVTGYRVLREDELTKVEDLEHLNTLT